jgi:hypothetical protein
VRFIEAAILLTTVIRDGESTSRFESAQTGEDKTVKRSYILAFAFLAIFGWGSATVAQDNHVNWTRNGAPTETYVIGGPWTLEQSGAAVGLKSAGYCDSDGNQVPNPSIERMQPYYFPFINGHGRHLQGYFDYRPKDIDEAVAAASSEDAGQTWKFQQKVLELRTTCPTQLQKDPDGDKDNKNDGNNDDNGDDDGQGHQFILKIGGHIYLYTLERANNHIDVDDLYIHELSPEPGLPLNGAPAMNDGPTDSTSNLPENAFHTTGLLNPDGILGVVPGNWPVRMIYEQKILNGDNTGSTAFPASQQCNTRWAPYYANNPYGTAVNDDITYLRLAETTDGIHFKDLGALQGLNDPTDVTATGTRWLATAGTILKFEGGGFGLLFSGGGCIDGDSDSFHYIGYAESSDLLHWTVVNGINNPIVSTHSFTIKVDSQGLPIFPPSTTSGSTITVPSSTPVAGLTNGFFEGRVYAPSATLNGSHDLNVFFAGYHTPKPKNGLGDYRTIGRLSLHADRYIADASTNVGSDGDE